MGIKRILAQHDYVLHVLTHLMVHRFDVNVTESLHGNNKRKGNDAKDHSRLLMDDKCQVILEEEGAGHGLAVYDRGKPDG